VLYIIITSICLIQKTHKSLINLLNNKYILIKNCWHKIANFWQHCWNARNKIRPPGIVSDNNKVSKWQNTRKAFVNKYHSRTHCWICTVYIKSKMTTVLILSVSFQLNKHKISSILWIMNHHIQTEVVEPRQEC